MATTTPTPAEVALVRELYRDGEPVKDIRARAGVSRAVLHRCLAGDFDDGSGAKPAAIPLRRARQHADARTRLVKRIWRTAQRQVEAIEDRLKAAGLAPAEHESSARMLATVARTLRELVAIDEKARPKQDEQPAANDDSDDDIPRDVDELRRALALRIAALVDSRTGAGGTGTAESEGS